MEKINNLDLDKILRKEQMEESECKLAFLKENKARIVVHMIELVKEVSDFKDMLEGCMAADGYYDYVKGYVENPPPAPILSYSQWKELKGK